MPDPPENDHRLESDTRPGYGFGWPSVKWLSRLWRAVTPDLAGELARCDDEGLTRLYDGILRNPRGLKGVHIRMVRDEIVRRGL